MAVVDVCTFNGENDIWDIHYNVLKDKVDEFIVCEAPLTFSGKEKPLYFKNIKGRYPKARYYVIDENDPALWQMARDSFNTQGAEHWKREYVQKESIKKALTHLDDDDIVFIGDVDEVREPSLTLPLAHPIRLKLRVFTYWLNNRSSEVFWGTLVGYWKHIKNECLNHLRSDTYIRGVENYGWHFTSMGGYEEVKRKLSDSYTRESYWTEEVESNLEANLTQGKDFLGRNFTYTLDETEWPHFLKENREKYSHLCK